MNANLRAHMFSMPKHCRFLCPSGTITRFPKKTLLLVLELGRNSLLPANATHNWFWNVSLLPVRRDSNSELRTDNW